MNERRVKRLQELIKARVAQVISYEMSDPRRGLITVTRVELDREMVQCKVYWSVLGDEKERVLNERMLEHATAYVQREVASILHTRTTPKVKFAYDQSIEGSMRVQGIIDQLKKEREERGEDTTEQPAEDLPPEKPD